ncbi:hypothetical protein SNOG_20038 [Parastagonospora nodorum SN15]|uniref:Uncharacterized protein n=1 Tax=Phaeosphaeria nodorum (strain SN15 / ATCC MYA-4574 / FGSC 10173) TaxID=321614 RepID=A9JX36_PHANO|nr:hypothetical protein SNOG_20038 [Parastagonospora nodorum SN15]EDP89894.1 hypothetical protein SNOG_20038 [Parastagonospora nodorum SN15]
MTFPSASIQFDPDLTISPFEQIHIINHVCSTISAQQYKRTWPKALEAAASRYKRIPKLFLDADWPGRGVDRPVSTIVVSRRTSTPFGKLEALWVLSFESGEMLGDL